MTSPGADDRSIAELLARPLERLPDPLPIVPPRGLFSIEVEPPGSKSVSNRALPLAALAAGESRVSNIAHGSDDVDRMLVALKALGVSVALSSSGIDARIAGAGGRFRGGVGLDLGNAGTATRFLTALACLADAPVVIDGDARMRERPIGELVSMLAQIGVRAESVERDGFPPVRVHPCSPAGGRVVVPATRSSQYVSALLLLAPWTRDGVECVFDGPVTSPSYIEMTLRILETVGGRGMVEGSIESGRVRVNPRPLRGFELRVEADASGAVCFWAAAALVPGATAVAKGVPSQRSVQPDGGVAELLCSSGCAPSGDSGSLGVKGGARIDPFDADLTSMPDSAMALAVTAAFASGPSRFTGLRTLRDKETDRIEAIRRELMKIGVRVNVFRRDIGGGFADEGIVVTPPAGGVDGSQQAARVEFDTYNDHRMAMAFALVGLRRPNVFIRDPGCVRKTYAAYWRDFARIYAPSGPPPGPVCAAGGQPRY